MWIVRWTLIVIIILAVLGFSLQNQSQRVQIYIGPYITQEMPLYFALYLAFAVGVFVFFLISIYNLIQLKSEIARQKKDNRHLREELNRLRNITIEEPVEAEVPSTEKVEGKQ
jgi:uncharacterized integral membrane protein